MAVGLSAVEKSLAELHATGSTPVEAIKAIRTAHGLSLADAKRLFSLSPAWAAHVRAGDELHNEIIAALTYDEPS